ncbi:hypothetical protein KSC_108830 [Ktedonobacter sp. SOSP1-52]|nr:hypothetical protein KSC_108830 [Ktedonobacter sp. SOSP1-52]
MIVIGFFIALNQLTYLAAIAFIGSTAATLIAICAAPVFVTLIAVVFLRERLTGIVMLALVGALSGTALLIGFPVSQRGTNNAFLGIGFALLSAIGYAGIIISGRFFASRYHPLQVTTIGFSVGALL